MRNTRPNYNVRNVDPEWYDIYARSGQVPPIPTPTNPPSPVMRRADPWNMTAEDWGRKTQNGTWRNASGYGLTGKDMTKVAAGQYVLGLVSVGILFFVIGYGLERGKDIA